MDNKEELMDFLRGFKGVVETKFEDSERKTEKTTKMLEKLDDKFTDMKTELKEMADKNERDNAALVNRIGALEEDMRRMKFARLKSPERRVVNNTGMEILPVRQKNQPIEKNRAKSSEEDQSMKNISGIQPVGSDEPLREAMTNFEPNRKQSTWAEEREQELAAAAMISRNGRRGDFYPVDWSNEKVTEKKTEVENKQTKETKKNWFGDDEMTEESSEESTDEEDNEKTEEWKQIERKEKNKRKRKIKKNRVKKLKIRTATKARNILGIGPVTTDEIKEKMKNNTSYEKAKIETVREYLRENLEYDDEELKEVKIEATKVAKDDTIYIAVEEHNIIKDLYKRKAEVMNDKVNFRPYIPPQYYERFTAVNKICKDRRLNDQDLKTQVRFGLKDIEVLIKSKESGESFKNIKLDEFLEGSKIPEFDDKIKWQFQAERPPRRKLGTDRQTERQIEQGEPTRTDHPMRRNRSTESNEENHKKQKTTALIEINVDGSFETSKGIQNISEIQ